MEVRYRGLVCVERRSTATLQLDKPGNATVARGGPVEQQGADLLLLRPGGAWIEYDARACAAGPVEVAVEVYAIANEVAVPLGGTVSIDGQVLGRIGPFHAGSKDERRTFTFRARLERTPERLRIEGKGESGDITARIARVRVSRALESLEAPRLQSVQR